MAGYSELIIDAGADFNSDISLVDDNTGLYVNLASYNVTSQIRKSYYSRNPTANFVCTISDSTNGNISISLTGGVTANITPGRYVFDVKAVALGTIIRVLEGIVTITPSVTRQ